MDDIEQSPFSLTSAKLGLVANTLPFARHQVMFDWVDTPQMLCALMMYWSSAQQNIALICCLMGEYKLVAVS